MSRIGKLPIHVPAGVTAVSYTHLDVYKRQINYSGKKKSRYTKSGIINGKQSAFKKAIVTLKEGETIDFFSNI